MSAIIILIYVAILVFCIWVLWLQIRMSNDIHYIRSQYEKKGEQLMECRTKVEPETIPATSDPIKSNLPSPTKTDLMEFFDKIKKYKKEHNKTVDSEWLENLIADYNSRFNEDFHQYI